MTGLSKVAPADNQRISPLFYFTKKLTDDFIGYTVAEELWDLSREMKNINLVQRCPKLKGALRSFWGEIQSQSLNIYSANEIITQTQKYVLYNWGKKLFSEEVRSPECSLKLDYSSVMFFKFGRN